MPGSCETQEKKIVCTGVQIASGKTIAMDSDSKVRAKLRLHFYWGGQKNRAKYADGVGPLRRIE